MVSGLITQEGGFLFGDSTTNVTLTGTEQLKNVDTGYSQQLVLYVKYTPSATGRDGNSRLRLRLYFNDNLEGNPSELFRDIFTTELVTDEVSTQSKVTLGEYTFKDLNDGNTIYRFRLPISVGDKWTSIGVYETKVGANFGTINIRYTVTGS